MTVDVLVIAPFPYSHDRGSPLRARRMLTLARDDGLDPVVLTFGRSRDPRVRGSALPLPLPPRSGLCWQKVLCDVDLLVRALVLAARTQPRVIEGHLHDGLLIGLLARLLSRRSRLVYNAHGTLADELVADGHVRIGSIVWRLARAIEAWLERRADHVLVQSRHRAQDVMSHGVTPPRVSVCPDAPEGALFDIERGETDAFVSCVYTGSMTSYQGIDDILCAARLTSGVRYVLYGKGANAYRDLAERLGVADRVELVDPAPIAGLPSVLAAADIALVPRRYGGNIPGKLPAYQAAALPAVGTAVAGVTELVDARTGVVVPPADPAALAAAITRLAADPEARRRMGAAARRQAAHLYRPESLVASMRGAYQLCDAS